MAQEWLRFLALLTGRVCKALVVDLDNTLWGGVIGEDNIEGMQLMLMLEEECHIKVSPEIMEQFTSVERITAWLEEQDAITGTHA
jgi:predicted enzyme involved in methoxymalonyl-ACP biosynthesis